MQCDTYFAQLVTPKVASFPLHFRVTELWSIFMDRGIVGLSETRVWIVEIAYPPFKPDKHKDKTLCHMNDTSRLDAGTEPPDFSSPRPCVSMLGFPHTPCRDNYLLLFLPSKPPSHPSTPHPFASKGYLFLRAERSQT